MQIFTNTNFDIIGKRKIAFILSALLILGGVAGLFVFGGFNLGIDFTGGVRIQVKFSEAIDANDLTVIRDELEMDVYSFGGAGDEVVIRNKTEDSAKQLAQDIYDYREGVGLFKSFDDLTQVENFPLELLPFFEEQFLLNKDVLVVQSGSESRKLALNTIELDPLISDIETLIERATRVRLTNTLAELRPADNYAAGRLNLNAQNSVEEYARELLPLLGEEDAPKLATALSAARNFAGVSTMRLLGNMTEVKELAGNAGVSAEGVSALDGCYTSGFEVQSVNVIGPKVGEELGASAIYAVLIALAGLLIYISLRFEFAFALGAIAALAHDVMVTLGIFVLLGKEINLSIIAALLTLIGYSLNDTIVVYDRIREDRKLLRRRSLTEIINRAVNETLSRTVLTSGTTLFVTLALVFFGGSVIHDFALALSIGVLVGTYSSIFIASPFLIGWYKMRGKETVKQGGTPG